MSTRVELQRSYILHTRPYRDTSLLVDVISQDYGKLSLVAKGARNPKNNQRYLLQPFKPVLLSWQGKSSLKTLIGIEAAGDGVPQEPSLVGDRMYSAMYANELLSYLLPDSDPTDNIFRYYQHLLSQLSAADKLLEPCLRYFEFNLLDELGYGINFLYDADNGESIKEDSHYFFIQQHGFVLTNHHPDIRDHHFLGRDLLNIAVQDFDDKSTRQTAKILSRITLQPLLRGRELKSRELFVNRVKPSNRE